MIQLPWQVVAAFLGLFAVQMILGYLRHQHCEERAELAKREARREWRNDYLSIFNQALADAKEQKQEKEDK